MSTFGGDVFGWLAKKLVSYRNWIFFATVFTVISGAFFAFNIRIDNSIELWFLESDPALTAYRQFKDVYGNDEVIIAMVSCEKEGLFSKDFLNKIWNVSKAIKEDKNIRRVLSVALAPYIGLKDDSLIVEDIMTKQLTNEEEADAIKRRFFENPLWQKLLADKSLHHTVIIIEPFASQDMDVKRPEINNMVKQKLQDLDYRLAGMGVMYDELNQLSIRDGMIFTTISYFVLTILVFVFYKSYGLLIIVATVMTLGNFCFLGFYGFFKQNFNMITVSLPTLMMILSISDVSYVFNAYCLNIRKVLENKEEGLTLVFCESLLPCLFTSITNFFGFISIATSPILVLRNFAIFASFVTLAEYALSMITAAFVLGLMKPDLSASVHRPFVNFYTSAMEFVPRKFKIILAAFMVLLGIGAYGISHLDVDTYSMGFLKENNPIRMDSDVVEKIYGNYLPLEVRLLTNVDDGIKELKFLNRLVKVHDELEAISGVEKAASIVDVIRRLNQVWTDGSPSSYQIPDTLEKVSQLMMLYESDPANDLKYMTDKYYRETRLTVRIPMVSASSMRIFENKVAEVLKKNFNDMDVKYVFGGYVPLYTRILDYITSSQLSSFGTALIAVFGAMAIIFRRKSALLLGIVPNVFPIVMTLGMMGILNIRLDIATVTIASITLGITVDDTTHELFLFFHSTKQNNDPVKSITDCIIECGPAVVSTSIIYAFGFCTLLFASIKSVSLFGGLIAATIFFGLICEVSILPSTVCFLKDFLTRKEKIPNA